MADPVQQAGGGEQIPASAVAPPTAPSEPTNVPEQKPPTAEPQKLEPEAKEPLKADLQTTTPSKAETPKTETPKAETLKAETPKAETPKAETPKAETPKAETPKAETPKAETPKVEPQAIETPQAEVPKVESIKAEPQVIESPKAELQATEPPKAESQASESQITEPPKTEIPTAEAPKAEAPTASPPTTQPQVAEPNKSTVEQVKKDETSKVNTAAPISDTKLELLPQDTENVNGQEAKEDVIAPESKQNIELAQTDKTENNENPVDLIPAVECSEKDEKSNIAPSESEGWQKRESELLKKIEQLEKVKNARSEDSLRLELKIREEEIDLLKARVKNLETELQAALSKPGGKNHEMIENIKQQHEELLSKARGMIFDKTKMVKNQELQIEALTTQVQSLKDINVITKDLLEIRNSEVKAMEERFQAMEARFKAEKERYDLVLKRAQTSTNINDDLRKEYETQLAIFKELREKYEQRVQALVAENNRLKEAVKGPGTSG